MGYFNPLPEKKTAIDFVLKTICDVIVVIALACFFIYFFCEKADVVGNSMSDEIVNGEVVLIDKMKYELREPKRFDVIVYKIDDNINIKRIIGLPGEKIKIVDSTIYIDGKAIEDKYFEGNYESGYVDTEIEIGPDEYFVMGDNRNVSEDSRFTYVGNIKYEDIIGCAWFVASPFNKLGFID